MKAIISTLNLFFNHYPAKWRDAIFYPLKDLPEPDFNTEYDSTML